MAKGTNTMTRCSLLFCAVGVLLGCSERGGTPPSPGGGNPSTAALPDPITTGQFTAVANVKLAYPTRVAAAGGTVYASDARANQVVGTDADGKVTVALTGLDQPLGLAVAGDLLYVGNRGRGDVEVYSLSLRKYLRSLGGAGTFAMPNAIAVAADGTVAVVDSKQNLVRIFSSSGAPTLSLGGPGAAAGQFNFPSAVAMDDTRIVVGDQGNHRVQIFDRQGAFVASFGGELTSGKSRDDYRGKFTSIAGVALAGADILVLDAAHATVQVLDGTGRCKGFLGASGDCGSCMKLGLDVAVAADGRVLVTDPENHRIVTLATELR
jgi:hypothetical protein